MGDKTAIEWTEATWNPVTGCTKVSPGCKFCYAERITERRGEDFSQVVLHPNRLDLPLRWRTPRRIFVNSMSDLFHEAIPDEFIERCFAIMALAGRHVFQVLTKRPKRMMEFMERFYGELKPGWVLDRLVSLAGSLKGFRFIDQISFQAGELDKLPFRHIWLGTSAEDQPRLDERVIWLLKTPAAVRFLSLEPLLGPVVLSDWLEGFQPLNPDLSRKPPEIQWVIVGGESGGPPERALVEKCPSWVFTGSQVYCRERPDHLCAGTGYVPKTESLEWVRSIRDQCVAAGVAFFHKQWGGPTAKSGGRLLDGRTWEEYPA